MKTPLYFLITLVLALLLTQCSERHDPLFPNETAALQELKDLLPSAEVQRAPDSPNLFLARLPDGTVWYFVMDMRDYYVGSDGKGPIRRLKQTLLFRPLPPPPETSPPTPEAAPSP